MIYGMSYLEIAANITTAICIFLAGRNNVHTWWTGIVACVLFGFVFYNSQLYADVTLQVFFVATGIIGWYSWSKRCTDTNEPLPIRSVSGNTMICMAFGAGVVAAGYGYVLHKFTNAYAPWVDSTVLTFSVIAQFTLMRRYVQTWPLWILVNVLSVPLYFSRELYLTSGLYAVFLANAIWSWHTWSKYVVEPDDEIHGLLNIQPTPAAVVPVRVGSPTPRPAVQASNVRLAKSSPYTPSTTTRVDDSYDVTPTLFAASTFSSPDNSSSYSSCDTSSSSSYSSGSCSVD